MVLEKNFDSIEITKLIYKPDMPNQIIAVAPKT